VALVICSHGCRIRPRLKKILASLKLTSPKLASTTQILKTVPINTISWAPALTALHIPYTCPIDSRTIDASNSESQGSIFCSPSETEHSQEQTNTKND
jgi:hypothetical protein